MLIQGTAAMEWCVSIPKIEVHAHLNGSVRDSTLLELARELGIADMEDVILKSDRALSEVFKLFDLIHVVTTDHKAVTRITKEVIEDFAADNVTYLELRTTPKRNVDKGMSKQSYMEAVLEGIKSVKTVMLDLCNKSTVDVSSNGPESNKIFLGLILSIDRRETAEAALETVELALEMREFGIVGIDLSGNPRVGKWSTFLPALEYAKQQGLSITLHCGEVPNPDEIRAMLDFKPSRVGHACCFDEDNFKILKQNNIPVEICLTSNIKTESISSLDVHHFADLYGSNHPIILCTDDCGVFSTSLSAEYTIASSTFGLGKGELFQLAQRAIEFTFSSDAVKAELKMIFAAASTKLGLSPKCHLSLRDLF